jgi:hypothetical protein
VTARRLPGILFAAAAVAFARCALAQSYGDEDQTLTIGALEFQEAAADDVAAIGADGYLHNDSASPRDFVAPLVLPSGAEVELLCIDYFDPSPTYMVTVEPEAIKLVPGGQTPEVQFLPGSIGSNSDGYGSACSDSPSFTFRTTTDIDYDGSVESVAYAVHAQLIPGGALGAVRVKWKRQISAPPASPTFGDVPPGDGAFAHVEALVASGITAGCGGGSFCPNATLTRRQMAVFVAKALGLHWPS